MSPSTTTASGKFRQCISCGKWGSVSLVECPHCHETYPDMPWTYSEFKAGKIMRRGLLYMALAGLIHYFAGGYSSYALPVEIPAEITLYLTPALFVLGLGFFVYGFVLRTARK